MLRECLTTASEAGVQHLTFLRDEVAWRNGCCGVESVARYPSTAGILSLSFSPYEVRHLTMAAFETRDAALRTRASLAARSQLDGWVPPLLSATSDDPCIFNEVFTPKLRILRMLTAKERGIRLPGSCEKRRPNILNILVRKGAVKICVLIHMPPLNPLIWQNPSAILADITLRHK